MKTKPIIGLAASIILIFTLPSCQKESPGVSGSGSGVTVQATNKTYSIPVTGLSVSNNVTPPMIAWDTAWMYISRITVSYLPSSPSMKDTTTQLVWQGPQRINLFGMNNMFETLGLPEGHYGSITYNVWALASDAGGGPVFYLSGMYTGTGIDKSMPIAIEFFDDIVFGSTWNNVTVGPRGFGANMNVYLDKLFAGILPSDLQNATLTNGWIIISPTSNPEIYRTLLTNLINALNHNTKGGDNWESRNNKQ